MSNQTIPLSPEMADILGLASTPGRRKSNLDFAVARELSEEDLLSEGEAVKPQQLKDIRASHHQLARLIARGEKESNIALLMGYSPSRISVLKSDPQFNDLVQHYKELEEEEYGRFRADFAERMKTLGFDTLEVLHQRLIDNPDSITNQELISLFEKVADRTGHGKTQTLNTNNAHFHLSAEELKALREADTQGQASSVAPEARSALLRLAVRASDPHSQGALEGSTGEGDCLREEGGEGVEDSVGGDH